MEISPEGIAREVLDVIPMMMRVIRTEMRNQRSSDLTVPQFRVLLFISRNPGTSLLAAAEYLGLTSPTVCKMVDGLVHNHLVNRDTSIKDRRQVLLTLTANGVEILEQSRTSTQARLSGILSPLAPKENETVYEALKLLEALFKQSRDLEKSTVSGDNEI